MAPGTHCCLVPGGYKVSNANTGTAYAYGWSTQAPVSGQAGRQAGRRAGRRAGGPGRGLVDWPLQYLCVFSLIVFFYQTKTLKTRFSTCAAGVVGQVGPFQVLFQGGEHLCIRQLPQLDG